MHRFAKFCRFVLIWTILVILWGAFVRATGSGAGCGNHWPTCNGTIIPRPEEIETSIEFVHRILSGGALIFIFVMLIWGWNISKKGDPVRKGLVASSIFILLEALLGASLVLFGLVTTNQSAARAVVMALHLLNTFLLLAALTLTVWWAGGGSPISHKGHGGLPALLLLGLLGVVIIGMTGAITALGDTLFPAQSLAHGLSQDSEAGAHFLVKLRIYHPVIAILVGTYLLYLIRHIRSQQLPNSPGKFDKALIVLILVQWSIGLINVVLLAPVPMQIIHLFMADLVWITLVLLTASKLTPAQTNTSNHLSPEVL